MQTFGYKPWEGSQKSIAGSVQTANLRDSTKNTYLQSFGNQEFVAANETGTKQSQVELEGSIHEGTVKFTKKEYLKKNSAPNRSLSRSTWKKVAMNQILI